MAKRSLSGIVEPLKGRGSALLPLAACGERPANTGQGGTDYLLYSQGYHRSQ